MQQAICLCFVVSEFGVLSDRILSTLQLWRMRSLPFLVCNTFMGALVNAHCFILQNQQVLLKHNQTKPYTEGDSLSPAGSIQLLKYR